MERARVGCWKRNILGWTLVWNFSSFPDRIVLSMGGDDAEWIGSIASRTEDMLEIGLIIMTSMHKLNIPLLFRSRSFAHPAIHMSSPLRTCNPR